MVQFCTVVPYALRPRGDQHQYMHALLLALLQWDPYMDALPGAAFGKENLEATLSHLQQAKEDDLTIVSIQHHQKQYQFLNLMSQRTLRTRTYRGSFQPGLSSRHRD